jgi:hypothetical protein
VTHPDFDAGTGLTTAKCARCGAEVIATFAARIGDHGTQLICQPCNRARKGKR